MSLMWHTTSVFGLRNGADMSRTCDVCGGPLSPQAKHGVCGRTPECRQERYKRRYQADPKKENERNRLYREANPERERERRHLYRAANLEKEKRRHRLWEYAHRKGRNKRQRVARLNGYQDPKRLARQQMKEALWRDQGGRCYLCEEAVPLDIGHLDHDHRCHPGAHDACTICIRGIACGSCNVAVGYLRDDPDRIDRVARNLRAKLLEVDERLTGRPEQDVG